MARQHAAEGLWHAATTRLIPVSINHTDQLSAGIVFTARMLVWALTREGCDTPGDDPGSTPRNFSIVVAFAGDQSLFMRYKQRAIRP